jgi:hypothetical protein
MPSIAAVGQGDLYTTMKTLMAMDVFMVMIDLYGLVRL